MEEVKNLKKGYTTGVVATFAFKSALSSYLCTNQKATSKAIKMDNDDLDVTKGCEIVVTVSERVEDLKLNSIKHKPYQFENLSIFAGCGVGVVTKDGLKPPKGYPAINPTPLKAIKEIAKSFNIDKKLYVSISVTSGEEIAKHTANQKVGVLGGISILGTTGFVKPVSAKAYLDSIEVELDFLVAYGYKRVALTLGNSSYKEAIKRYKKEQIVEIGNYVHDAINFSLKRGLEVELFVGIAKAVKVAQGFKNTHNRFGSIDFKKLSQWVKKDLEGIVTVKRVCEMVDREEFYKDIEKRAKEMIKSWFKKDVDICLL